MNGRTMWMSQNMVAMHFTEKPFVSPLDLYTQTSFDVMCLLMIMHAGLPIPYTRYVVVWGSYC